MKPSKTKLSEANTPVFPKTMHHLRTPIQDGVPKSKKRDNTFSKSRDTREDRGARQAKTSNNAQTLSRGK